MNVESIPMALYKANIELQLRISRLLQENGHLWLESMQQSNAENIEETTAEIEGLLRSANWQALATLPVESFWRHFQNRVGDTQTINQIAVKNQAAFMAGVQQALESWQKAVAETLNTGDSTQSLPDIFAQWGAAWPQAGGSRKKTARKGAE